MISTAYIQDQKDFISTKVFPIIPVDKKSDLYFKYTKNDWFRDEAQERAPGSESAGGGHNLTTDSYNCTVYAWHEDVPDQTRENSDQPLDPDQDATLLCTQKLLLKQEITWTSQYFGTGIWGTDVTPTAWSNYTSSDPITDIKTGRATVLQNTGYLPNTLVLGFNVFEALRNHPDVVDRYKYTTADAITEDMLARLFQVDRVLVAKAVKATNIENETEAYSFVQGNNALLVYANPRPGLRMPSGGYTFAWKGLAAALGSNVRIKSFYLQWLESTRVEGESAWDQHVVGSDLGYYFNSAA
jgi:hypothetical protein